MIFLQSNITPVFAFLTLVSNVVFVLCAVAFFVSKDFKTWVKNFLNENILSLLFGFSFVAMAGSLSYSQIVGFPPCELCWIQRIFMYPQVLIAFIAAYMKDKSAVVYMVSLSVIGAAVAFFHSMIHWGFNSSLLKCSAVGAPCAKVYILEYGYITLPFMAFTSFVYLAALGIVYLKSKN